MKKLLSIFLLFTSLLVVAHAIIPHHHHSNRIYLLLEEEHEHQNHQNDANHNGDHQKSEGACHHGNHPDELLICAANNLDISSSQTFGSLSVAVRYEVSILPAPQTINSNTFKAFYTHYLPLAPPKENHQLRAPPVIA